jgi:hypothetical protein
LRLSRECEGVENHFGPARRCVATRHEGERQKAPDGVPATARSGSPVGVPGRCFALAAGCETRRQVRSGRARWGVCDERTGTAVPATQALFASLPALFKRRETQWPPWLTHGRQRRERRLQGRSRGCCAPTIAVHTRRPLPGRVEAFVGASCGLLLCVESSRLVGPGRDAGARARAVSLSILPVPHEPSRAVPFHRRALLSGFPPSSGRADGVAFVCSRSTATPAAEPPPRRVVHRRVSSRQRDLRKAVRTARFAIAREVRSSDCLRAAATFVVNRPRPAPPVLSAPTLASVWRSGTQPPPGHRRSIGSLRSC